MKKLADLLFLTTLELKTDLGSDSSVFIVVIITKTDSRSVLLLLRCPAKTVLKHIDKSEELNVVWVS